MSRKKSEIAILVTSAALIALTCEGADLSQIRTIKDLDKTAAFSFAIMSDNKSDSPKTSPLFGKMVEWIADAGDRFVIGLGDHVAQGLGDHFLRFLDENQWWHDHFYPNVADHENGYYGKGQWDWGAGKKIFEAVDLKSKKGVKIRDNGAEYYAKIEMTGWTIHLIQLSYPDQPEDPEIAFRPDSREYLVETIQGIKKGDKDIIIACAHSCYGSWIGLLSKEQQKVVMEKADLVLSATTHIFTRIFVTEWGDSGALCINTGSITYPRFFAPPGYVQVHVLENPTRLIVQYIQVKADERKLQPTPYAWIKQINGKIEPAIFPGVPQPPGPEFEF